jgi:hypothetical protein
MKRIFPSVACAFLVLATRPLPAQSPAFDALRQEVDGFADRIRLLLQEHRAVAVGQFIDPPDRKTSSGPGIQYLLIQALKARKMTVRQEASLFVTGAYRLEDARDKVRKRYVLKLEATVRNKTGVKLLGLQAEIDSNEGLLRWIGPSANLNGVPQPAMSSQIRKCIDDSHVLIQGSEVKASKTALCSVEVLVGGAARPARNVKGQAFVTLKRGETYVVRVRNSGPHEAAVSLTIDGLDAFTFSAIKSSRTGRPRCTHYLVGPGKHLDIKGWHRNNEECASFQVADFRDSAPARGWAGVDAMLLTASPALGTLTVCFHAAWDAGKPPPAGVQEADRGTAFGPPVTGKGTFVKRTIGTPREVVTIHYGK